MPLSLVGTLPVSAINVGLAAGVPGLALEIGKLTAEISDLALASQGQIQIKASGPPSLAALGTCLAASLNPTAAALAMGGLGVTGKAPNLSIAAKIGFLSGQIAAIGAITGTLGAGLNTGGISGWNYAGRSAGFGEKLEPATASGYPGANPDDAIIGIVVATESLSSWGSFSKGFSTGASSSVPVEQGDARLIFMGTLGGAEWNKSVSGLLARFNIFVAKLKGQKGGLELAAKASLGLNLPSPSLIGGIGLDIVSKLGASGILAALNVTVDLPGLIGSIQAKIDAIAALQADFGLQLSAGGLSVWTYSGRAGDFGKELRLALVNGLPGANGPNATAYGLAIAGSPPAMGIFGGVFGP